MKDNQEYIVVQTTDLRRDFPYRTNESLMRSLEHYLDKNRQLYNLVDGGYIIHVDSKIDALRMGNDIGLLFGIKRVGYFNGEEISILVLVDTKRKSAPRATVEDTVSGEKVSLRKYKEDAQNEIDQKYISFRDISGRKIISSAKLKKLVSDGSLKAVDIGSKQYVDKTELLMFLKKK